MVARALKNAAWLVVLALAATAAAGEPATPDPGWWLGEEQEELGDQTGRLQQYLSELYLTLVGTEPENAARLREALERAGRLDLAGRMAEAGRLLKAGRLLAATAEQERLLAELEQLIALLEGEEDLAPGDDRRAQRLALENLLREMLERQQPLTTDTEALAGELAGNEPGRAQQLRARALGAGEAGVAELGRRAAELLATDETAVVFPRILEGVNRDLDELAGELAAGAPDAETVARQRELERRLAALADALAADPGAGGEGGRVGAGGPNQEGPPPLVGLAAELRLLGELQETINAETERLEPGAAAALAELAGQQGLAAGMAERLAAGLPLPAGENPLAGVAGMMREGEGRLAAGDAGAETRAAQAAIAEALRRLLAGLARGGRGGSGGGRPLDESRLVPGGETGDPQTVGPGEAGRWGELPAREREAVEQYLQENFPGWAGRFATMLAEYYRILARE